MDTSSFSVTATATNIQILGTKAGLANSSVASFTYTLQVAPVTASPVAPYSGGATNVTLSTATTSGVIHYRTDGTAAACTDTTYTSPISVASTETITAIGCKASYDNSAAFSGTYTITGGAGTAAVVGSCAVGDDQFSGQQSDTSIHPINTTGATLLVISAHTALNSCAGGTVDDLAGNNWHCVGGTANGEIWYAYDSGSGAPLAANAANWARYRGSSSNPTITFMAFSGTLTGADPLRSHAEQTGPAGTTQQTGSITPTATDLVIAGVASSGSGATISSPLTLGCVMPATTYGLNAIGYQLNTAGGAINPTWSSLASGTNVGFIAAFKTH
jgi:hypothetical protein